MLGNIFISGQALRIGPNKIEQFVPGQLIADRRPQRTNVLPRYFHHSFVLAFMLTNFTLISFSPPGQMVNCESGKKFVPGQDLDEPVWCHPRPSCLQQRPLAGLRFRATLSTLYLVRFSFADDRTARSDPQRPHRPIGDIVYIDDEGVRYFESAVGFASRRNSSQ